MLTTDEKTLYPKLAREAFGSKRLRHTRVSSRLPRDTSNPLFRINLTNAVARDLCGRLRRRSWLVSKKARHLDDQLAVYTAYRNYARPRFNRDKTTPAQRLGFIDRRLTPAGLISWRQDWGEMSPHPTSRGDTSIGETPRFRTPGS